MTIYYYYGSEEDIKPNLEDWDIFNFFLPRDNKYPKVGTKGLRISPMNDEFEWEELGYQEEVEAWNAGLPENGQRYFMKAIFTAKNPS